MHEGIETKIKANVVAQQVTMRAQTLVGIVPEQDVKFHAEPLLFLQIWVRCTAVDNVPAILAMQDRHTVTPRSWHCVVASFRLQTYHKVSGPTLQQLFGIVEELAGGVPLHLNANRRINNGEHHAKHGPKHVNPLTHQKPQQLHVRGAIVSVLQGGLLQHLNGEHHTQHDSRYGTQPRHTQNRLPKCSPLSDRLLLLIEETPRPCTCTRA